MAEFRAILDNAEQFNAVTAAVFGQVDADSSGSIDKGELRNAFNLIAAQAEIPPPSDADIEEAMKELDSDQSGTIDVEEFKVLIRQILEALAAG